MNSIKKMLQYAIEKEQRNISRKNEEAGLKQKWKSIVDLSGGKVKSDDIKNNTT